jgi:phosphohistidine phosphatase
MDLILWRHAEASDAEDPADDIGRPLTQRGQLQARRMAQWLNCRLAEGTRVLVSPAVRAQQTAEALGSKFRTAAAIAPGADAPALLHAARWPDSRDPVLLIGHQPAIGQVIATLVGGDAAASWPVRKAGVWWLRSRERDGTDQVVVVAVQNPEML